METGLVIKPSAGVVASDYAAPGVGAANRATQTELPVAQSVPPASAAEPLRNDLPRQASTQNQVIIDPHSRDVIFQVIDVRSRRVVRQLPDEALVRLRAYTRTLTSGESAATPAPPRTDLEV